MLNVNIGISEENLKKGSSLLNVILSDEFVLYAKTRNYHWNVVGSNFMELHKLFEGQYDDLASVMDEVAERVRHLGGLAVGSFADYLNLTRLTEENQTKVHAKDMLKNLLSDHEKMATNLRNDIKHFDEDFSDIVTADFLTGVLEKHEKTAWMLRSYLQE